MTYFALEEIFEDIPILKDESKKNIVKRYGTEADEEINDFLKKFPITVPLATQDITRTIKTAANLKIKAKYFRDQGEIERADSLDAAAMVNLKNFVATKTQNNLDTGTTVVVESSYQMIPE